MQKRTKKLTVCAMLAALGVIILAIGSVIGTLDLSAAALASILCIYVVIEIGGSYPWMLWGVTSLLGILLLQVKTPAIFYLFIGCYPILKEKLEKLNKLPSFFLKLGVFHIMLGLVYLILRIFFTEQVLFEAPWMLWAVYGLGVLAFLIYDYALTKLITFYLLRLRDRLKIKF
jgi:hypothetical protein